MMNSFTLISSPLPSKWALAFCKTFILKCPLLEVKSYPKDFLTPSHFLSKKIGKKAGCLPWTRSPLLFSLFAFRVAIPYIHLTDFPDPRLQTLSHGHHAVTWLVSIGMPKQSAVCFSPAWFNWPPGVTPVAVSEWRIKTCPCGLIM